MRDQAARGKFSTVTNASKLAAPHNQLLPAAGTTPVSTVGSVSSAAVGGIYILTYESPSSAAVGSADKVATLLRWMEHKLSTYLASVRQAEFTCFAAAMREHVSFYECVLKILQQRRDAHVKHTSLADKHIMLRPFQQIWTHHWRDYVGENSKQQM